MSRATVLVVEDDRAIRRGLVDALRFAGYSPLEAGDGDGGLATAIALFGQTGAHASQAVQSSVIINAIQSLLHRRRCLQVVRSDERACSTRCLSQVRSARRPAVCGDDPGLRA